jgi:hypothetical protein
MVPKLCENIHCSSTSGKVPVAILLNTALNVWRENTPGILEKLIKQDSTP